MEEYKIPEEIENLLTKEQKQELLDFHKIYNWINK